MKILGLDISTSAVGICFSESTTNIENILSTKELTAVEFKKCKTLWEKADVMFETLTQLQIKYGTPDLIAIEEPLMGFKSGMSSASTITTLMRFNGIVSYIARNIYSLDPTYINAAHARKLCGIKLVKTAIGGPQKEQVFSYMKEHDLAAIAWPLTKTGKIVSWSRD